MARNIPIGPKEPYYAVACEMIDAAARISASTLEKSIKEDAPGAVMIELAKLLTRFETQIDDAWRHDLIMMGGALFLSCTEAGEVIGPKA